MAGSVRVVAALATALAVGVATSTASRTDLAQIAVSVAQAPTVDPLLPPAGPPRVGPPPVEPPPVEPPPGQDPVAAPVVPATAPVAAPVVPAAVPVAAPVAPGAPGVAPGVTGAAPTDVPPPGQVDWAGHRWEVREGGGRPHVTETWSRDNVQINPDGSLTLRITRSGDGVLTAAEVDSVSRDFGYGTYRFTLGSSVTSFDPSVVLGMFILTGPAEIDVEASGWGRSGGVNWDHTLHRGVGRPSSAQFRDSGLAGSVHEVVWLPNRVTWTTSAPDGRVVKTTTVTRGVPVPTSARVALNLWVFGASPGWKTTRPAEVTVLRFSYEPLR